MVERISGVAFSLGLEDQFPLVEGTLPLVEDVEVASEGDLSNMRFRLFRRARSGRQVESGALAPVRGEQLGPLALDDWLE